MRCEKCGAEWNGIVTADNAKCPFCGEILSEEIPYKQVIDSLRMLVERFGGEIYLESQRLDAMVNDLVPNALKEKNIIRSAISFNIPSLILDARKDVERRDSILEQAYHAIVSNGIDKEWCPAILFMLSYPLEVDTRLLYPIELRKKKSRMKLKGKASTKSAQKNQMKSWKIILMMGMLKLHLNWEQDIIPEKAPNKIISKPLNSTVGQKHLAM